MSINGILPPVSLSYNSTSSGNILAYVADRYAMDLDYPVWLVTYTAYHTILGFIWVTDAPQALISRTTMLHVVKKISKMMSVHLAVEEGNLLIPSILLYHYLGYEIPHLVDNRYTYANHLIHTAGDVALLAVYGAVMLSSGKT